jgi:subtilisin family serine protease
VGSNFSVNQHQTFSPTVFGHAAAAGAVAVAAEFYGEVGSGDVTAPAGVENVEAFSSLGPAVIYFNAAGAPLGSPQPRSKPEITAPDGANTSFFGSDIGFDADAFPNFFGTSAAAPHAAAVAALLVEALDDRGADVVPSQVYQQMKDTCVDIESAGVDSLSGHGRIDAQQLLALLETGDFDDDGDVDLTDFLTFENCFSGPGSSPPGGCDAADLDFDGDVDLADFAVFQRAFTG